MRHFPISRTRQPSAWSILLPALLILGAYRAWIIVGTGLPLYVDEAQYWLWSRSLDWGYYSKPPMVAWVIRLFSGLGDGELSIRAGSLLLHTSTAVLVFLLGRRMFDSRTGLFAALLFASMPLVGFNSLFMTTDAPLLFFWGLATWALWRALEHDRTRDWLLLGAAVGLGLLSKYSMAVFAISATVALCRPGFRRQWRNRRLYLAALLSLLIFLPNMCWNARMDFVSFRHTAEISQLDRGLFHPARLMEFMLAQAGCLGPIGFGILLAALCSPAVWKDDRLGFLAAMSGPFLAVIALQALLARANANWAAPAVFAGSLLIAAWLNVNARVNAHAGLRWWALMVGINLAMLSGFYHYRAIADSLGIVLSQKSDPYSRVRGWPEAGAAVKAVLADQPDAVLATTDRNAYSLLSYYARPLGADARFWNPEHRRRHHFDLTADLGAARGANVIFATTHPMREATTRAFAHWRQLGEISIALYPDCQLRLYLYRGDRFLGYQP